MKNILLSSFFFLIVSIGSAYATSDAKKDNSHPAKKEAKVENQQTVNPSTKDETTIEIKINGDAMGGEMWWKIALLIIWTGIIIVLVIRTFRGKAEV